MRRGEIWTVSGGKDHAGKPRPVVKAPLFRLLVEPNATNGLLVPSRLMIDKITTVPKSKVGHPIGRLDDEDIVRFNRATLVFLGLAGPGIEGNRE